MNGNEEKYENENLMKMRKHGKDKIDEEQKRGGKFNNS